MSLALLLDQPKKKREINRICPAISPTLGAELLTDPGLEANYTAGQCDTLTKGGSPTLAESADAHGGTKAQSFIATAQYTDTLGWAGSSVAAGTWLKASLWSKRLVGTRSDVKIRLYSGAFDLDMGRANTAEYSQLVFIHRVPSTAGVNLGVISLVSATFDTIVFDDGSVKALTFSTAIVYLGTLPRQYGTWTCKPTVAAGTQAGLIFNYKDSSNYLHAYINRVDGKAYLDQVIGGTVTNARNGAITYSATADLAVKRASGSNVFQLFYDDTQVGLDATIDQDSALGKAVYGFASDANSSVGLVTTSKAAS